MKFKMLALILALSVASWAQTTTPTAPSTPQQSTQPADKAKCSCCDKTTAADAKETPACCAHHEMNSKDSKKDGSCCAGKNASAAGTMSCMRHGKQENASCCKDGCDEQGLGKNSCAKDKTASACCNGNDGKGCCSGKKTEKTAKSCCKEELHS